MKLRHKLLLLAAMPLPAILLVALLSVVPRWEQIRDSRVAGNVAEALDAASRMTGALIDERTAVMQRRANDAVSLESRLTLDNANLDSLLDAPEGNALGDAVIASDRAISAYAEAISPVSASRVARCVWARRARSSNSFIVRRSSPSERVSAIASA